VTPRAARKLLRESNREDRRLFERGILVIKDVDGLSYDISDGIPKQLIEYVPPSPEVVDLLDIMAATQRKISEMFGVPRASL
jgi:uncharacterized protein YbaR (Trm112 family)